MIPIPSLSDAAAWLGVGVLGLALVVAGTWLGRWTTPEPNPVTKTDTVTVEREITRRDTVTEAVPRKVIRYDTVRTTDTVRVPVPERFDYLGAIERRPIDVQDDEVTLTYFRDGHYMQNRYDIPQPTWAIAPSVTAEATPEGVGASAALTVTRKSLAVSAGYEVAQNYHGWSFALTWTPYEVTW
jgi:hypothetical protein